MEQLIAIDIHDNIVWGKVNVPISDGFDFPVGKPDTPKYRPSILQRASYKRYLEEADDRALSNSELTEAKGSFRQIEFRYYGLLNYLKRIFPNHKLRKLLTTIDLYLTHKYSPIKN